jgi:hypothetical protein
VTPFALHDANAGLDMLRRGDVQGAAVLVIDAEASRSSS